MNKEKLKRIIILLVVALIIFLVYYLPSIRRIDLPTHEFKKDIVQSTGCNDFVDLYSNMSQDKKIIECSNLLKKYSDSKARLEGIFDPQNCKTIKAESGKCTKALGTQLVCTYNCYEIVR